MIKYKLEDISLVVGGGTPPTTNERNYDGDIVWITPKDLSDQNEKFIERGQRSITLEGFNACSAQMIPPYNILMSSRAPIGLLAINRYECCTNQGFKSLILNKDICDVDYVYYYLKHHIREIESLGSGTTFKEVSKKALQSFEFSLPELEVQLKISKLLSDIDAKITLNRSINHNLEAMAKQLYDYWFVQFDFPDENGMPYKSSGGKMVWNEKLKREIPEGWNVCRLSEFVSKNNAGDWGTDDPFENSIEIGCIRGADIIKLNNLPKRYIKSSNRAKILSVWDVVIEVSGGSPIQATGRSAFITSGVIERNGGQITCSNFCHAFSFKDYRESAYFFYIWRMFYDNGIMFNYEGKTSGIKNFMTETFLANKWVKAPKNLIYKFFDTIKSVYSKIDANITESNDLIKLRDSLLPLLMNGQVSVNYDLSND